MNKKCDIHLDDQIVRSVTEMSPNKLSVRDVYFRLCSCLDREIELVWKRAVFLTAFLIAAFTAYGGLIAMYLGANQRHPGDFAVVSITAIGISVVGMALSVIWIMMAKGSKAWQEHYEKVIECFVAKHKSEDELQDICASGNYLQGDPVPTIKAHGLMREKISGGIFNCSGGPYSVSKIVIVIGQGALLVWILIAVAHTFLFVWEYADSLKQVITSPTARGMLIRGFAVIGVLAVLLTLVKLISLLRKCCFRFKSVYLSRLLETIANPKE